jgi:uncharacterized membrane protein YqaE (UPF0057 family)
MAALQIVAAILLPPLGIFLSRGLGRDFWIGIVLTLIAFLPGVVFALYVVLHDRRAIAAPAH